MWSTFGAGTDDGTGGHCDESCDAICEQGSCGATGGRCEWVGEECKEDSAKTCYQEATEDVCEEGDKGCFWLCGVGEGGGHCEAPCEEYSSVYTCTSSRGCEWRGVGGCKRECGSYCGAEKCLRGGPGICKWEGGKCTEI
ncbi:hypothetical protein TrCOL_g6299 [Triparma columacea]|uniref:Uncharacterized protein n=1 Tax=Triparma columacea TaxID=722753 RepID=A0A9W7GBZ5_9STRA|nr:hypothetical protein TrCOL_g6299 [Triparma columacea]